ncbi:cupredoxin superfamily protein [Artemisia annua]|uniref:Cupredoxin superfamily protein n=1 Tax=Artemisia annua TaxID=35608 RepID=A0A2U1L6Y1_ARTAN|nr:cupredoxin superfamily protein [Artemisia annua]
MTYTIVLAHILGLFVVVYGDIGLVSPSKLEMFVDEIPDMPRIKGYDVVHGVPVSKTLKISMFQKHWKFHKDLPPTKVFAYGETKHTATVPGPTIEAMHGVSTYVTWKNHLPSQHILPVDDTIPTAIPRKHKGIPTVVHLHGGIDEPQSDGNSHSWFTSGFKEVGPMWSKKTYHYHNKQQPGNLYYHDHAMGLTRVNILAGLFGAYIIRDNKVEAPLGLPSGDEFDRTLIVVDRGFRTNGSIYMDTKGNNPSVHPVWQPEYFGDVIIVNGKAWPYMNVRRRKYRFRIINSSNARFFKFFFGNGLRFIHVASDSVYNEESVMVKEILMGPSEISDVVVDFSKSKTNSAILHNGAAYPFPGGDPVNENNSKVMKFIISGKREYDSSRVPKKLLKYPAPKLSEVSKTRYIAMYEYASAIDEPLHLYINALSYDDPVTEKPKVGTTEIWNVINLTEDNHPLHIHLGLFKVLDQTNITNIDEFRDCMNKLNNAQKCNIEKYATGNKLSVEPYEKGWKNVYKMQPGVLTRIIVKFAYIHTNASYPFDATAEPGYVYHCHILDHEDNVMMRPLKLVK